FRVVIRQLIGAIEALPDTGATGMRWTCLAGLAATLALALAGCNKTGSSNSSSANSNEIVIGHVASLTGDTATFGVSADEGIRLASSRSIPRAACWANKSRSLPKMIA